MLKVIGESWLSGGIDSVKATHSQTASSDEIKTTTEHTFARSFRCLRWQLPPLRFSRTSNLTSLHAPKARPAFPPLFIAHPHLIRDTLPHLTYHKHSTHRLQPHKATITGGDFVRNRPRSTSATSARDALQSKQTRSLLLNTLLTPHFLASSLYLLRPPRLVSPPRRRCLQAVLSNLLRRSRRRPSTSPALTASRHQPRQNRTPLAS